MKIKQLLIILSIGLLTSYTFGQNEVDALRFSQYRWGGTARFLGAGGAFGAVGADFSALSTNPASIGLFKKNEISFTPLSFSIYRSDSRYNEEYTPSTLFKSNFSHFGAVFSIKNPGESKWKRTQFGIGFNQIMNFGNKFSIEGRSNGSTMALDFASRANGLLYDNFPREQYFAYQAYLIDPVHNTADNTEYIAPHAGKDFLQSSTVYTSGRVNELSFSFGGNYDDKLYLGATLGVPFLSYLEERKYKESDDLNVADQIQSFYVNDRLDVSSTGVNLKLGLLYQPVSFLRVGAAIHTPTLYRNIHDVLEREMVAKLDTSNVVVNYTNDYNYQLITPMRYMGNMAFLILSRGFVSAEYEYTDYSTMEMGSWGSNSYTFKEENKNIKESYQGTHSIRLGAEVYLVENFLVRGGFSYTSSPYKNNINDGSFTTGSIGVGFRGKVFFADFAFVISNQSQKYWLYNHEFVNPVEQQFKSQSIVGTIGWKL
ncbi:MAG TPA: hypothetical protein GX007_01440 [Bacteroidales bacterium]|jgi:long-subunit fatty acid transport protein|nr:hypothetical protein [Bacteroidales bacterium]